MARKPAVFFLHNKAYRVRLPTGLAGEDGCSSEWDTILAKISEDDDYFHWSYIWSWCAEPFRNPRPENTIEEFLPPAHRTLRGCTCARAMNTADCSTRGSYIGFRPIIEAVSPDSLVPDHSRWKHVKDGEIISLGTLYMNGRPVSIPKIPTGDGDILDYKPGTDLRIGKTHDDPAYQLRLIKCGTLLISDRNLIKNISWNDLDRCGLIYGEKSRASLPKIPNSLKSSSPLPFIPPFSSKNK